MALVTTCNCCFAQPSTRMCLSCDPTGNSAIYMCNPCSERAHFGPMKLSHCVKSLVNAAAEKQITKSHNAWSTERKQAVTECVQELKAFVINLDHQKKVDSDIMSAAFDPLKNAVINRKRDLTTQINSYYDSMKPSIADAISICEERLKSTDSTKTEILMLDDSMEEEEYSRAVKAIEIQMTEFQPSSIEETLPVFGDGHRIVFPSEFDLDSTIIQIQNFEVKIKPTEITDDLVNTLSLTSGDVVDVIANQMDNDGIFWLKRYVAPEGLALLCQLTVNCRRSVILGTNKRYSEHPQDLHSGMIVMANLLEENIWRRAVVVDPCVKDKRDKEGYMASIVQVDTGLRFTLPYNRLAICSEHSLKIPFTASPCSLYPEEHQSLNGAPKWLYNDLIKEDRNKPPKVFRARFIHKKNAQHVLVPVWYVELIDPRNPSRSINDHVEDERLSCAKGKGAILHKDIRIAAGEVSPSQVVSTKVTVADSTQPHMAPSGATADPNICEWRKKPAPSLFDDSVPPNDQQSATTLPPPKVSLIKENSSPTVPAAESVEQARVQLESQSATSPAGNKTISRNVKGTTLSVTPPVSNPQQVHTSSRNSAKSQIWLLNPGDVLPPDTEESQDDKQDTGSSHQLVTTDNNPNSLNKETLPVVGIQARHASCLSEGSLENDSVVSPSSDSNDGVEMAKDHLGNSSAVSCDPSTSEGQPDDVQVKTNEENTTTESDTVEKTSTGVDEDVVEDDIIVVEDDIIVVEDDIIVVEDDIMVAEDVTKDNETVDETIVCDVEQDVSSGSTTSPTETKSLEEWQEPSSSAPQSASYHSEDAIQRKPKRGSNKKKSRKPVANIDTASDPGAPRHGARKNIRNQRSVNPSHTGGGDCGGPEFCRLKIVGQKAVRNWISAPTRDVSGLPPLSDMGDNGLPPPLLAHTTENSTLKMAVERPSLSEPDGKTADQTSLDSSTQPTQALPHTADGTDQDSCGWQEHATNLRMTEQQQPIAQHSQGRKGSHPVACYNCGSTSHKWRNCQQGKSQSAQTTTSGDSRCSICHKDHRSENCNEARFVYENGGCPYCLSYSHLMVNCSKLSRITHIRFQFLDKKSKPSSGKRGPHW